MCHILPHTPQSLDNRVSYIIFPLEINIVISPHSKSFVPTSDYLLRIMPRCARSLNSIGY